MNESFGYILLLSLSYLKKSLRSLGLGYLTKRLSFSNDISLNYCLDGIGLEYTNLLSVLPSFYVNDMSCKCLDLFNSSITLFESGFSNLKISDIFECLSCEYPSG
jgi:hypothetical protein